MEFPGAGRFFGTAACSSGNAPPSLKSWLPTCPTVRCHGQTGLLRRHLGACDLKTQIASVLRGDSHSKSIDYGVMEKSDRVEVVPADFGWSLWEAGVPAGAHSPRRCRCQRGVETINPPDCRGCRRVAWCRHGMLVALVEYPGWWWWNCRCAAWSARGRGTRRCGRCVEELEKRGLALYL